MIKFFIAYALALSIIGLSGLDSVERSVVSHADQIVRNTQ